MPRWGIVALWAAGLAVALAIILPARLVTDLGAFLPTGATPEQELVADQLRRGAASRLLIVAVGDGEREVEPGELERLRERLLASERFALVLTHPDPTALGGRDELFTYRYLLSDRLAPADFRVPALQATFDGVVTQLRRSDMVVDEAMLARDPTGEFSYLLQQWLGGRSQAGGDTGWRLDDGRAVMLVTAAAAPQDLAAQAEAIAHIEAVAAETEPALDVRIGGAPAVAAGSREIIRGETIRVSTLASIAAVTVLVIALRALPAVLLALVPVITGLVAGVAAVRLGFGEVHGITLAFGATLLGVTLDYPLHHLWRSRVADGVPAERAIRRPLFVGALSTAVGFAALAIAGVAGLQQLAVLSVTGIVVAAVVTSWVLPALWPRPLRRVRGPIGFALRCPPWLALAVAGGLLLAGALAATTTTRLATDLASLSPVPPELAERDGDLRAALGLAEPRYLVAVRGDSREAALQATEQASRELAAQADAGALDRFEPVARLLPSAATQGRRAAALPPPRELEPAVAAATADLPLRPAAFAPFIDDVSASRELPPLEPEMLPAGLLRDWIEERLLARGDHWLGVIPLGGVADPDAIAAGLASGELVDLRTATSDLVTGYQRRAVLNFAVGAVLIAGVLWLGTASLARALRIVLVAGGAVGGTVLLLTAMGTALSVFHVIALLLVVGLSIDYGVFARPGERAGTGSVTICAASSALAFGLLATADIPLLRAIGLTVACGTILAWGLAMLFAGADRAAAPTASMQQPDGDCR